MEVPREELPNIREVDARSLLEKATAIALDYGYRIKGEGEEEGDGKRKTARSKRNPDEPQTFFQRVNTAALEKIEPWAKALFPSWRSSWRRFAGKRRRRTAGRRPEHRSER
jgi:hypothetical protein